MIRDTTVPDAILAAYGLQEGRISPLGKGLINGTWLVEAGDERFVLQCVNPIFPAEVNVDIDVVTQHVEAFGLVTCRIVPSATGGLWVPIAGQTWRLLTFIDGVSHDSLTSPQQAESAGALLAGFHHAVGNLEYEFTSPRLGIHDTAQHLAFLRETLRLQSAHPCYADVAQLAARILAAADDLPSYPQTLDRIVHGDPKINNLLFTRDTDIAFSLVDLDTLARMPLPLELGDAMRSWCNPAGEDDQVSEFCAQLFEQSIQGYAGEARDWITPGESAAIVSATETILIELAARFCADALNESYFGWNPDKFATRSEHNQERAASQLHVVESLAAQRQNLEAIVAAAF
ncbi:MAG: phosphotransferase [Gammaproteobacteria bacterium]|jgi:Ser/Thr protein kinase RdoA (MazF antagonist)|nr:hypothetical protein [Chromatiales bacterium]MDP6673986.1 phosphotransferase [Gammaproteobacteria bacterium]